MTAIAGLTENFEGGVAGNALTTANSFFDQVDASAPTFSSDAIEGSLSMAPALNAISTSRVDFTAATTVWFSFYLKLTADTTTNTAILSMFGNSNTNKVLDIRVLPGRILQLRSVSNSRWDSTALTLGQWYRVAVGVTVGSTCQLKIYGGANLHTTTASQSSGLQDNTNSTATNGDALRIGTLSADATLNYRFDYARGDNATEPAPLATSSVTVPIMTASGSAAAPVVLGGNSVIAALSEDFEGGSHGAAMTTTNSFFDSLQPASPPLFNSDAYQGALAMAPVTGTLSVNRVNFPATGTLWVSFYFKLTGLPTSNTSFLSIYQDDTARVGDLQVMTDGSLRLRSVSDERWVSNNPLTVAEWCRISVGVDVGGTIQARIYTGVSINDSTPDMSSGLQSNANTTATTAGNVRLGMLSSDPTFAYRMDYFQGDSAVEPQPLPIVSTSVEVVAPMLNASTEMVVDEEPQIHFGHTATGGGPMTASAVPIAPAVAATSGAAVVSPTLAAATAQAVAPAVSVGTDVTIAPVMLQQTFSIMHFRKPVVAGDTSGVGAPVMQATLEMGSKTKVKVNHRFYPPTHEEPIRTNTRPLNYYRLTHANSIVKINGVFTSVRSPSPELLEGLEEGVDFFRGGREYDVDYATRVALTSAGF